MIWTCSSWSVEGEHLMMSISASFFILLLRIANVAVTQAPMIIKVTRMPTMTKSIGILNIQSNVMLSIRTKAYLRISNIWFTISTSYPLPFLKNVLIPLNSCKVFSNQLYAFFLFSNIRKFDAYLNFIKCSIYNKKLESNKYFTTLHQIFYF